MFESIYSINNLLHTIVGSIALVGGVIALITVKGSDNHKKGGKVFAWLIVLSAISSFYPTITKFNEIGPVAIVMAVATIYLVVTSIIAIRHQQSHSLVREKFLILIPLFLAAMPLRFVIRAIKTSNYEIFMGPLVLLTLFLYCLITDIMVIRNRNRSKDFWLKRHLTRMIFAFSFGVMALVRIGIDFGITFEMSLVLPLLAALLIILFFRRRVGS